MTDNLSRLETFFAPFETFKYEKGLSILQPEDEARYVFYLRSGYVRMYTVSESGKQLTLNIFKPASYFPMTWAIGEMPNNYYFEAMTDVNIQKITKERFLEYIKKEPDLLYDLTRRILVGLGGILTRMEYLLSGSASSRVASTILLSARRFGVKLPNGDTEITLPLTHQEIANLSGLTRESTSVEMGKLAKSNVVIAKNRKLIVKDMEKLKETSTIYIDGGSLPITF
ncbi:MAG: Crp/Fnr family transcriptional regulator [Patescibacteria group bacterium]|jgi:CRP/FNR family transcriptional regulator